jgi:predicted aspartyl protease
MVLPISLVTALGLQHVLDGVFVLADGSRRTYGIYLAEVEWGSGSQSVTVSAMGQEALLGMTFLEGHELRIEVKPGGLVELRALP